jgi:restriction system protein
MDSSAYINNEEEILYGGNIEDYLNGISHYSSIFKKETVESFNPELLERINKRRECFLSDSIENKIHVWDNLIKKNNLVFNLAQPTMSPFPIAPVLDEIPNEPKLSAHEYSVKKNILDLFFKRKYNKRKENKYEKYISDLNIWEENKQTIENNNSLLQKTYHSEIDCIKKQNQDTFEKWLSQKNEFEEKVKFKFVEIKKMEIEYFERKKEAIEYFNKALLMQSYYDEGYFNKHIDLFYNTDNRILVVDYTLPNKDFFLNVKEVRYINSRDAFDIKLMNKNEYSQYYDDIIYQITLRTIYEIFFHDEIDSIEAIAFNGYPKTIDKATGQNISPCILSLIATKEDSSKINFSQVDYKACFKNLKGVSASTFINQTPIIPLIQFDKNDKRFVLKKDILNELDEKINLASMDWEEFEHLVREVFEKEFSSNGGEVKVTRASRDGGVDAIAFDPDPIRGGKIVIQAKRYTNTVGVSAVRDLYGTVLNEGATKGILVTTSDYGSDSYEFAKGKPITLLNGSNLLYLLEKHGHKAKIDLEDARKNNTKENL